jgi:hypothetical protein
MVKKIKVGTLKFKEFAAKKPIAFTPDGKFVTPSELIGAPSLGAGSLLSASEDLQTKLTIERNKLEPNFKLGIVGLGVLTKSEIIDHVKARSDIGQEIIRAEMIYCDELAVQLGKKARMKAKSIPKMVPAPVPPQWKWIPQNWWKKWHRFFRNCTLFCENTTDSVTQYAANYRIARVHSAFVQRGFTNIVLKGVDDVRSNFPLKAKSPRVVYIAGIGHGSPTTYTGHYGSPILSVGSYDPAEVAGKVIHLLSCQTARMLGPDLIKNGARAYAGYFENFRFVYDQAGTPIDEMELFWKSDSTFDIMMAKGSTVEAAHKATIAAFNQAIAQVPGTAAATWLTWDRNCFRSPVIDAKYGDKTAKITPFIMMPLSPLMELEEAMDELVEV